MDTTTGTIGTRRSDRRAPLRLTLALLFFVTAADEAGAERYRFQWEGRLTASEHYDDNIFLTAENREDDWITRVTPGVILTLLTEDIQASLLYDFSLVHYAENDERSIVRHYVTLTGIEDAHLAKHVTLDLDAHLLISEDPLEIIPPDEDVTVVDRARTRYYRTTVNSRFSYLLGPENSVYGGFNGLFLSNEDEDVSDRQRYIPLAGVIYWFNVRYGVQGEYSFQRAAFEQRENYEVHEFNGSFRYRSSPRTEWSLSYLYNHLDYEGPRIGYDLHETRVGVTHEFTENTYGSLSGGYSVVVPEEGDNLTKPTGTVSLAHLGRKFSIHVDGTVGYRRQFFSAANLGLSFYASASASFEYEITQKLSATLGGGYFRDEYVESLIDRESDNWRATTGLNYDFLDWLTGSVTYTFRERQSTDEANNYKNNRVGFFLTATYSGRPRPL